MAGDAVALISVEPGPPLALEVSEDLPPPVELTVDAPPGALVVLYSDGLTDRRGGTGTELDIWALLDAVRDRRDPAGLADALVEAADSAGHAEDDTSVLVGRV